MSWLESAHAVQRRRVGLQHSSPCSWCWSHCFGSCCCCGASWPCGTFFTTTPHSSPWRQHSGPPNTSPLNTIQSNRRLKKKKGVKTSEVARSLISLPLYLNSGERCFLWARDTLRWPFYYLYVWSVSQSWEYFAIDFESRKWRIHRGQVKRSLGTGL